MVCFGIPYPLNFTLYAKHTARAWSRDQAFRNNHQCVSIPQWALGWFWFVLLIDPSSRWNVVCFACFFFFGETRSAPHNALGANERYRSKQIPASHVMRHQVWTYLRLTAVYSESTNFRVAKYLCDDAQNWLLTYFGFKYCTRFGPSKTAPVFSGGGTKHSEIEWEKFWQYW